MYALKAGVTYPDLLHANSRSQIVLSYTYILHRYWKKSVKFFYSFNKYT